MRQDDLDRILTSEQDIIPSVKFVASVMDAVRRESEVPPIAFPWKHAVPGLCAAGLALMAALVLNVMLFVRGTALQPVPVQLLSSFRVTLQCWNATGASWIVLALVLSLASVKLFPRFVPANLRG